MNREKIKNRLTGGDVTITLHFDESLDRSDIVSEDFVNEVNKMCTEIGAYADWDVGGRVHIYVSSVGQMEAIFKTFAFVF